MSLVTRIYIVLFLLLLLSGAVQAQTSDWKIKKTDWTESDEKSYSEFVSLIGQAVEKRQCNSLQSCLQHPNNPYRGSDTASLSVFADCAKLSYVLRGYFAWKNGLPFSVTNDIQLRQVPGNAGDKRYSNFGNNIVSRYDFIPKQSGSSWKLINAIRAINQTIPDDVYSANFRFHYDESDDDKLFADFYPIILDRDGITAGTNIYDPNGHVAIVYKVTDDGKIYFIDAHPDNSLTSGLFGQKFVRSNPGQGAGFKNFRPYSLVGAQFNSVLGSYVGGVIKPKKNNELPLFDIEQFFGTDRKPRPDWSKGPFVFEGRSYTYYDYLREKLSVGSLHLYPAEEIKSLAEDICQTVQDRVEAVNTALKTFVQNKTHPDRLPTNIYGTSGEWEDYSTPSRDARLKTSFVELRQLAEILVQKYNSRDPQVIYNGTNIKFDMLQAYQKVSDHCAISYLNSSSQQVTLNLEQIRSRLFSLSFDPYHCVELRWGATAQELSSCQDDVTKKSWYVAEQWLRNQIERRYDVKMNFSLSELTGPMPGAGVQAPPDTNIINYLSK